jgi:beta-lactamase class A
MRTFACLLCAAALALGGCGITAVAEGAPTEPQSVTESAPPDVSAAITNAVAAVPDGSVSIAVFDRQEEQLIGSYQPDKTFPTESVVKLLIAMEALDNGTSRSTVSEMLSRSDDQIASELWRAYGARQIVTRQAARIGMHSTTPPSAAAMWGETRTTANDLVTLYRYILDEVPKTQGNLILTALQGTTRYGADGFEQHFGIPEAAGDRSWAVKQGWACCNPDRVLHSTGVLDDSHYIVIVLTSHDASTNWDRDKDQLTDAVRALLPALPT